MKRSKYVVFAFLAGVAFFSLSCAEGYENLLVNGGFETTVTTTARAAGAPDAVGAVVAALWRACDRALPDSDFTRVYEYLRERSE